MEKGKIGLKKLTLFLLLSTFICLPLIGWAGNPPPPGSDIKFSGPAIVGTVTFTPFGNGTQAHFEGTCQGRAITKDSTLPNALEFFTKEALEGSTLGLDFNALGDCLPNNHTPIDLVINTVTKYKANANFITADVVILFERN